MFGATYLTSGFVLWGVLLTLWFVHLVKGLDKESKKLGCWRKAKHLWGYGAGGFVLFFRHGKKGEKL